MKYYPFIILPALILFDACRQENLTPEPVTVCNTDKILRLGDEVEDHSFFVQFEQSLTADQMETYEQENAIQLQPAFVSTAGNEALEKQFGLDRWYKVTVSEKDNLDQVVLKTASQSQVRLVQYNTLMKLESEGTVYPADIDTKATANIFNDPYFSYQWHYINTGDARVSPTAKAGADINVKNVWTELTCGDPAIIVAVIDEGVKNTHPDLKDNIWVNSGEIPGNGKDDDNNGYIDDVYGYNFVANSGTITWDLPGDEGHGTHCAGTIAAVNNNGIGVSGVAGGSGKKDGCRIMSCQIFSGGASGSVQSISNAIKYAADNGASIISCSFGSRIQYASDNAYIRAGGGMEVDALHYFEAKKNNPVLNGNIAIFASGNEEHGYAHYPGAFADIISVSALAPDGLPAFYTNYGPGCDICAPGGEAYHVINKWNSMILSTIPSEVPGSGINGEYEATGLDYGYMHGTSMACPHVSGVVALGLSYAKKLGKTFDRDDFKHMILASVNDVDQLIARTPQKSYAYGIGPLQLARFYHQMGTGAIDAWRLMMKIEGTPSSTATIGKQQWIDLTPIFGTASESLTYLAVDIPEQTVASMGLNKIQGKQVKNYPCVPEEESYAYIQYGRLYIYPTKIGSGKITITAVGGGDHLGGGDNPPGGMELTQTISLISREADGNNGNGGWL